MAGFGILAFVSLALAEYGAERKQTGIKIELILNASYIVTCHASLVTIRLVCTPTS